MSPYNWAVGCRARPPCRALLLTLGTSGPPKPRAPLRLPQCGSERRPDSAYRAARSSRAEWPCRRRLGTTTSDEPRRRARLGCGAGRGRARRSGGASCIDGAGVPRADGPRTATPAVPAGGAVVHAVAGAPRCAQSARRVAARQRVVAGGQRATAAGRMRNGRAPRWVGRRAVIAGRAPLARVRREPDGAQLVPSAQREHRGRIPGAPEPRRSRKPAGALLHERRVAPRASTRTRSPRRRDWRSAGSLRSAGCSATPGSA